MSKPEVIHKVFKGVCKGVDPETNTVEAVISDETVDRYREVILAKAWKSDLKNYKAHPVLLSSHDYYDLTSQIGVCEKIKVNSKDRTLEATFKYLVGKGNPQADWGFTLAQEGLAAFSVGFIPRKSTSDPSEIAKLLNLDAEKDPIPYRVYLEVELLEVSQVLIPANPSALQKGIDDSEDPVISDILQKSMEVLDKLEVPEDLVKTISQEEEVEETEEKKEDTPETKEKTEEKGETETKAAEVESVLDTLVTELRSIGDKVEKLTEKITAFEESIADVVKAIAEEEVSEETKGADEEVVETPEQADYLKTLLAEDELLDKVEELTRTLRTITTDVAGGDSNT